MARLLPTKYPTHLHTYELQAHLHPRPEPVKRFVRKDTASLMCGECSVNWNKSGNGNPCFCCQLVQSVRHSIVRPAET
jgi:hypothetical protein